MIGDEISVNYKGGQKPGRVSVVEGSPWPLENMGLLHMLDELS